MPSTTALLQFAFASLLLALTPGPSVVLLLAVGTERGRGAALLTAVGLALGTAVWVVVVAVGLGAVFVARPGVVDLVSALGGCYLLWLAIRAWREALPRGAARAEAASRAETASGAEADARAVAAEAVTAGARGAGRGPLRDGAVVNLLNPSIAPFLAALLPTFLAPDRSPAAVQVLALGGVFVAVSTVVNAGWGLVGGGLGRRLRRAAGSRRATLAVVVAYGALGLLALAGAVVG